jgi:hypothetical protein
VTKVFFDESGNTGQNLIDEADPIFTLASCSFNAAEEHESLLHFREFQGPELKFSRLRKSPKGQRAVLAFLKTASVTSENCGAVVFHKPFMVVTKYCDVVLEPSFRQAGLDFYERGLNIATANLLATTMSALLNPVTWLNFLSLFVRVVRERSPVLFSEWKRSAELIYAHLEYSNREMAYFIAPVFLMSDCSELMAMLDENELDPLVPAYHAIVGHWGRQIGCNFEVIADNSKVLAQARQRLLTLSDPNLKSFSAGYDQRRMEFPLKVSDIVAVDSTAFRQVQLADVLGGAITMALKARIKGPLQPASFAFEILKTCFSKGLIVHGLWPGREVDPSKLGTDIPPQPNDIDLAPYTAMILKAHPSTKKVAQ